jgi:hypothetical protein
MNKKHLKNVLIHIIEQVHIHMLILVHILVQMLVRTHTGTGIPKKLLRQ